MAETLHTERLVLRRYRKDDAETINRYVRDPRIYRNVGKIPPNQTVDDTRAFLARSAESWREGTGFGLAVTLDGALIGIVGGGVREAGQPMDVGYWIAPQHWGRGIATEAFQAYLDWLVAEKGQRGVTAGYFDDNPGSGRVLQKTGFMLAGRSRYMCLGREAVVDCIDMARIA